MIADLKPYAEYKESGLPWLGQVPGHWRVVRNGSLFTQRNQTDYAELPILEVSLKTGVRVRDFARSARKQVMSDIGKYKRKGRPGLQHDAHVAGGGRRCARRRFSEPCLRGCTAKSGSRAAVLRRLVSN